MMTVETATRATIGNALDGSVPFSAVKIQDLNVEKKR